MKGAGQVLGLMGGKKRLSLWRLGLRVWPFAFGLVTAFEYCRSTYHPGSPWKIDWPGVVVVATALMGLVVMIAEHVRAQPSPEQKAALSAIFAAGPGTIGAVLVTRDGVPEVIATVRSLEEYLELAGSGQLPHDHRVYLPADA
ncbi:MAG TPA: hypothetical protein VFZ09_03135 [Archangium sp.]|uniref:hypothetical protein n=1 Tax=Archangium sp. TaxID=1872627 RepID=UPI002E32BDF3|nr:hypothetical protein [Archangium sp.]HEX5745209.1 hypothetical protein [Archangium sp.]